LDRTDIFRIGSWKWIIVSFGFTIFFGWFIFGSYSTNAYISIGERGIDSKFFLSSEYISRYVDKVREAQPENFVYLHVLDSFFALSYFFFLMIIICQNFS
jgi:hypothetical protein